MAISQTARDILACVCSAFEEAARPLCKCYGTVGNPYVVNCCDCDESTDPDVEGRGQAIFQVERIFETNEDLQEVTNRVYPCKRAGYKAMNMTIWITRCWPTIDEQGYLDPDDVDAATDEVLDDMETLYRAFVCCPEHRLIVRQVAVQSDPQAGCSTIVGQVTVEVKVENTAAEVGS